AVEGKRRCLQRQTRSGQVSIEAGLLQEHGVAHVSAQVEVVHTQFSDVRRLIDIVFVNLEVDVGSDLTQWRAKCAMRDKVAWVPQELSIHRDSAERSESLHRLVTEKPLEVVEVQVRVVQVEDDKRFTDFRQAVQVECASEPCRVDARIHVLYHELAHPSVNHPAEADRATDG